MAVGQPTGDDLCVGTTDGNTLPQPWPPLSPEEREITFVVNPTLTAGTKYAIVVRAPNANGSDNRAWWYYAGLGGGNVYSGGNKEYSSDSGVGWSSSSSDLSFKEYAGATLYESASFADSGSSSSVFGTTWFAQTFTPSVTHNITSVKIYLCRVAGGVPGTITVSIRATESVPEKPINPAPVNAADDVTLDQATIEWEDGGGATSYDVYYGENEAGLTLVSEGQAGTSFTITGIDYGSLFDYLVTRSWRIDAVNEVGTTTGDVWTFTTLAFLPPLPTGVTLDGDGLPTGTASGLNNMITNKRLIVAAANKIFYESV